MGSTRLWRPSTWEEAWIFGTFLLLAAGFQIAWSIQVAVSPPLSGYAVGALVNGSMIAIWLLSRTIDLPIGPEPWSAESAGRLDVTATVLELAIVAGSVSLWSRLVTDGHNVVGTERGHR